MVQIGEQLLKPESGWHRYDDRYSKIMYTNSSLSTGSTYYDGTVATLGTSGSVSIKAYTDRVRIIGYHSSTQGVAELLINGIVIGEYNCNKPTGLVQALVFEVINDSKEVLDIQMRCKSGSMVQFDAIDIDEDGYLIAQVGCQLLQLEPEWRRYDDSFSSIKYVGDWIKGTNSHDYNGSHTYTNYMSTQKNHFEFKLYSSKFRIICACVNGSNNVKVYIDDEYIESFSIGNLNKRVILVYEKLNLSKSIHTIKIENQENQGYITLDAIDVDEDGHICEDNCQLYHGAKYLLKDNSTNELYTLSESNEVVKLDTNVIHSQQFITNGFETITLLNNHTSVLNSNYSILAYTEESTFKEATATFNHEPKSLLNENYDLLMLSDTDGTLKLNAILQDQIVKGNGDIDLSGIKRLDKIELVSNNIKAALSFDSGLTWNALFDGIWQSIDITNISEFNSKGMTNTLLAEVPGVKLEELRGESDKLRLAYLLSQEELNNPAYTDSLSLKVTLSGKDTIAANSEWSYVLLDDLQILEYTFNQNGTYTINYAY